MRSQALVGRATLAVALAAATWSGPSPLLARDEPAKDLISFLELREIDRSRRAAIESAAEWSPDVEATLVKVLQRIEGDRRPRQSRRRLAGRRRSRAGGR